MEEVEEEPASVKAEPSVVKADEPLAREEAI
jgi:hypothetical protein